MNKIILEGIVDSDPTIRYFGYEHVRADFMLRTQEAFPPFREGDDEREVVLRHMITAWGQIAELVEEQVLEGQTIRIEGRLSYDKKVSREGEVRTFPVVDCQQITILHKPSRFANQVLQQDYNSDETLDWSLFAPDEDEDPIN